MKGALVLGMETTFVSFGDARQIAPGGVAEGQ